jgi:preprotein translocase subunit SecG
MAINCLNCGAELMDRQNFCSYCGQKTDTPRISFLYLTKEFLSVFAHADKGLFNLIKMLAFNPGQVAIDYVEGRRKRYFNPFGFLVICIALSFPIYNLVKPAQDLPQPEFENLQRIPAELQLMALNAKERAQAVQHFFNKNINLISVFVAPYFAFMLWLFFRRRKRNISEITLAYLLFIGFGNIISAVIFYPLMAIFKGQVSFTILLWISMFVQIGYDAWGMKTFFQYKTAGGFIKVLSALLLIGFIGLIILLVFLFFYVYQGSAELLYYLSQANN